MIEIVDGADASNYAITKNNGVYTITQRPLTYTINNAASYYGNARADLSAVLTEGAIKNYDVVSYTLNAEVGATTGAGEFAITGVDTDDNYEISFVNGTYTVNKRPITVTYTSTSKSVTYGDEEAWIALGNDMQNHALYLLATATGEGCDGALVNGDSIFAVVTYKLTFGTQDFTSFDQLGPESTAGKYL